MAFRVRDWMNANESVSSLLTKEQSGLPQSSGASRKRTATIEPLIPNSPLGDTSRTPWPISLPSIVLDCHWHLVDRTTQNRTMRGTTVDKNGECGLGENVTRGTGMLKAKIL